MIFPWNLFSSNTANDEDPSSTESPLVQPPAIRIVSECGRYRSMTFSEQGDDFDRKLRMAWAAYRWAHPNRKNDFRTPTVLKMINAYRALEEAREAFNRAGWEWPATNSNEVN